MNKVRILIPIILAVFAIGCGMQSSTANSNPSAKRLKIAIVTNNSSDWWTISRKGAESAASQLGDVDIDFHMLAEGTAAAQRRVVEDILAKGVDGIMISPIDVDNQKQMLDDTAARVPMFTLGADAPTANRAAYVGTDDTASGLMAAELVRQALPNGGKIMVFVGRRDAQNAVERLSGLKRGLEGSNIEIVDVRTDEADAAKAKSNAADSLSKYPDLNGLVGLWSYNTPAILNAVRDAGKTGKVVIVGFDEEDQTLQGIKDGHVFGTVVQQPYGFTSDAVRRMALFIRGDKAQIPADRKAIFPTQKVQKEQVDSYWEELRRLRGR